MSKHPPGLDGSRYRCCCHHVNQGALVVGVLGLLLTWYNPISLLAHIFLIIGYLAQNHRFHYLYIVLGTPPEPWSLAADSLPVQWSGALPRHDTVKRHQRFGIFGGI
ncbi:hypothetical protein AAVH_30098 [Aphelenchoides avenae]|nr:hypothetical protein AAVH_30098 [Aphelenchus avenae]